MKAFGDFLTFVYRILLLYLAFMICRTAFYFCNADLIGAISWGEVPKLLQGALIYDSGSIFYINLPFLFFSLVPFRFRAKEWYQRALMWLFVTVNTLGLALNIADIFYYPYKLARIASDDLNLLTGGNFGTLMRGFLWEFRWGVVLLAAIACGLWLGFRRIGYRPGIVKDRRLYYPLQTLLLALAAAGSIILIRGGNVSKATYPINISDASLYAAPEKTALIVSNPFALIRTLGSSAAYPEYFPEEELDAIYTPVHIPSGEARITLEGRPNIVLIVLESFASAHIKELSDGFAEDDPGYTPFLDSLIREGYIFRNAYHNGIRSIDALPSLWASIPSFKTQFLALPQSSAPIRALPQILKERGYGTAFLHGAVKESMSFVAFGKKAGVDISFSREEYEKKYGKGDFDGKWGIWDHKFLPFAAESIDALLKPFFATLFTLSSHHPFELPAGFEERFPEGNLPIHRMIAYSDAALREFFAKLSVYEWYENTLFVITADHGSGADSEKYLKTPYNYAVPLLFYTPDGALKGEDTAVAGHIDLMPTILGLLDYREPYFAFGRDLFGGGREHFTMNYMGAFNMITDSILYIFDGRGIAGAYNYIEDPLQQNDLSSKIPAADPAPALAKAFIQQYYRHIRDRNFTAGRQ